MPTPPNALLRALRPAPYRGDVVAAGVVMLAVLVLLVDLRFAGAWSEGARFAVAGVATLFVGALAVLSVPEGDAPRAYQTVLYVGTCLLGLLALGHLAHLLGARSAGSAGAVLWITLAVGLTALWFSLRRGSSYCTLLAALAFTVALQAGWELVFDPSGATAAKWLLLLAVAADVLGVGLLRDRRRRHAVMLIDAAGVALLLLAVLLLVEQRAFGLLDLRQTVPDGWTGYAFADVPSAPWGWMLVILLGGCGLVAYAGVDREPGPGYLGLLVLVAFAVTGAVADATLLGWPLVLAVAALVFLGIGLRPSRPLPPEPPRDVGVEPETVPLPRRGDDAPRTVRPRGDDEL
jgi:hypothetical protein